MGVQGVRGSGILAIVLWIHKRPKAPSLYVALEGGLIGFSYPEGPSGIRVSKRFTVHRLLDKSYTSRAEGCWEHAL